MSHEGVVIMKRAGHAVPEAFLKAVWEANQSCSGAALVAGDELLTGQSAERKEFDELQGLLKEHGDKDVVMFLGNFPSGFNDADVPPFDLFTDGDENVLLTAFLEGDFSNFHKTDSARWDAHHLVDEYLKEKLFDTFASVDEDMDKFVQKLESPLYQKEMTNLILGRGSITLVPQNGKIITYSKGELGKQFEWGWASYVANDKEEAAASGTIASAISAVAGKAKNLLGGKKAEGASSSVPAVNPNDKKPVISVETSKQGPGGKDLKSSTASEGSGDWVMMAPPPELKGNSNIKGWYKSKIGRVPENWKSRPEVPVPLPKGQTMKSFKEAMEVVEAKANGKDIPKATPEQIAAERAANIVSAEEKKRLLDAILPKIIDRTSKAALTPEQIMELEEPLPTFADIAGMESLDQIFGWTHDSLRELSASCPGSAALLIMNLRSIIRELAEDEEDDEEHSEAKKAEAADEAAEAAGEKKRARLL